MQLSHTLMSKQHITTLLHGKISPCPILDFKGVMPHLLINIEYIHVKGSVPIDWVRPCHLAMVWRQLHSSRFGTLGQISFAAWRLNNRAFTCWVLSSLKYRVTLPPYFITYTNRHPIAWLFSNSYILALSRYPKIYISCVWYILYPYDTKSEVQNALASPYHSPDIDTLYF